MDATFPVLSPDPATYPALVRDRVETLRDELLRQLGQSTLVEIRTEPSAIEEEKGSIRYTLCLRAGVLVGMNVYISLTHVESDDESAPAQPRLWVTGNSVARVTDRINGTMIRLGCVLTLVIAAVAAVVWLAPQSIDVSWRRFADWFGAVVLSYAILFALLVPLPRLLLRRMPANRRLAALVEQAAAHVMGPPAADSEMRSAEGGASE